MKIIISDVQGFTPKVSGDYELICPEDGKEIHHCIGCFGCWLKTPGICVIHDGFELNGAKFSKISDLILVSKNCYGGLSPFVKKNLDRALSYMHPDFKTVNGELHHKRRYRNKITVSWHIYGENITSKEKKTAQNIADANAVNYDGKANKVCFYESADKIGEVTL